MNLKPELLTLTPHAPSPSLNSACNSAASSTAGTQVVAKEHVLSSKMQSTAEAAKSVVLLAAPRICAREFGTTEALFEALTAVLGTESTEVADSFLA